MTRPMTRRIFIQAPWLTARRGARTRMAARVDEDGLAGHIAMPSTMETAISNVIRGACCCGVPFSTCST